MTTQPDWDTMTIMLPPWNYPILQKIIDLLKEEGFTENDWCALNRQEDGAHVNWGPCEPPQKERPYPWEVG